MRTSLREQKQALIRNWRKKHIITDERLLSAFGKVPRENFIAEDDTKLAYADHPLPILCSQTISQPTTVMLMSQALEIEPGMKILEVGTGSGYQAAVLSVTAGSGGRIISIEYFTELADFARVNLDKSGFGEVTVLHGDGGRGYEAEAPYDRIIVTCACPGVPPPLTEQLVQGGILVLPVKNPMYDEIQVIRKTSKGFEKKSLGAFIFVPLRGQYGI